MPNIIIHLSKENVQDLIQNRDIVVGSAKNNIKLSIAMPSGTMECSFFDLFQEHILRLKQNGSLRTAETYIAAYKKLRSFCNGKDLGTARLDLDDIAHHFIEQFFIAAEGYDRGLVFDKSDRSVL